MRLFLIIYETEVIQFVLSSLTSLELIILNANRIKSSDHLPGSIFKVVTSNGKAKYSHCQLCTVKRMPKPCSLQPGRVPALLQTKVPVITPCLQHSALHLPGFTPVNVMECFMADLDGRKS